MFKLRVKSKIDLFIKTHPIRFFMPGHKGKRAKDFKNAFKLDVTEIDYLNIPLCVNSAEKDIAKIYSAPFCRILSTGATGGIFSIMHAVKDRGKKLIINRSAHKSVYNALTLFGIEPITVGGVDEDGLPSIITAEETELALIKNPDAIGVFYTYPDYYGRVFDIEKIASVVKKHDKLLLIDNAHGAHIKFVDSDKYAGKYADLWVDGAHKTLYTLSQGALVFCKEEFIDALSYAVDMLSTTSPNYAIVSSVEYGVKEINQKFNSGKDKTIEKIAKLKEKIEKIGLKILSAIDPYKLCIDFSLSGIDAIKAEKGLRKYKIYPEMNDGKRILFMFSSFNTKKEFRVLFKALIKTLELKEKIELEKSLSLIPERKMEYLKAKSSQSKTILLKDASGEVSAVDFGIFPPCYPLVLAGEEISEKVISTMLSSPQTFGVKDGKIKVVIKNER